MKNSRMMMCNAHSKKYGPISCSLGFSVKFWQAKKKKENKNRNKTLFPNEVFQHMIKISIFNNRTTHCLAWLPLYLWDWKHKYENRRKTVPSHKTAELLSPVPRAFALWIKNQILCLFIWLFFSANGQISFLRLNFLKLHFLRKKAFYEPGRKIF